MRIFKALILTTVAMVFMTLVFMTKAIWLGPWRDREDQPLNLNWTKEPVRALGIFVSYDENANEKRNFTPKVRKLNTQ